MDFALTAEQQQFQQEVRRFLREERVRRVLHEVDQAEARAEVHPAAIYRWLGEKGWLAVNWPRQYGGLGKTAIEAAIVSEEMCLNGIPDTVHVNTIDIIGLFLLLASNENQKARYLPPMARGEMIVSVLYTEPSVGSDLSGLQARAESDGTGWHLYGRKIYSLKSHMADYGLCAVRTGKGPAATDGISLFMVPLRAPGVTIHPIWSIHDERFNEIVLDGVRVTTDDLIGPLNGGWRLINAALSIERTGLDYYAKAERWLTLLKERAVQTGKLDDPAIARELAVLDAEVQAGRLMAWRVITGLGRGELDDVAAAMSKWYNSELGRKLTWLAQEMDGLDAVLTRWDGEAPMEGILEAAHREVPGLTISAGSSEIMLYLIAVGLKLNG